MAPFVSGIVSQFVSGIVSQFVSGVVSQFVSGIVSQFVSGFVPPRCEWCESDMTSGSGTFCESHSITATPTLTELMLHYCAKLNEITPILSYTVHTIFD